MKILTIKYFSMFIGIGGFEYGLQQSKHDDLDSSEVL